MVERQLRRRGIEDERVLEAMGTVPRERFVPEPDRKHAYRDGALRIGEGQTISQPWIVASMAALLDLRGGERVLEVGTGSGYGAAVLSRLCREVVTVERHAALARIASSTLAELGYDNVEVRTGDGSRGAPDRSPFDGISVTATARGAPPRALCEQLAPQATLVCPVARDGRELLMRFRGTEEEALAPVRFVPLLEDEQAAGPPSGEPEGGSGPAVSAEFSAGGVVVRRFRGRPFAAVIITKKGAVALPKGHPDGDESALEAAVREVREETGLEAEPVEKLDDVRYWYVRRGERRFKIVRFFLLRYRSGSVRDHDHEVVSAHWIPLADAPQRLTYPGEREIAVRALEFVSR